MFKHSFAAISLMGSLAVMACSSSNPSADVEGNASKAGEASASGSTSSAGTDGTGTSTSSNGGTPGIDVNTGGAADGAGAPGTGSTGAGSTTGDAGSSSTGTTTDAGGQGSGTAGSSSTEPGAGGSVSTAGASSSDGGVGTSDPLLGEGGLIVGDTEDPPLGDTEDPPPGDTEDPPPGDTEDPPPGDTEDPPPGDTEDPPPGDTEDPPPGDTEDPPPGDTDDPPDECIPDEFDNVNVIVFKDAVPSGADSEGAMYVGGNMGVWDGETCVQPVNGYGIDSKADNDVNCTDVYGLVVGGNVCLEGGGLGNGMVAYGGSADISNFTGPCGYWKYPDSIDAPVDFIALEQALKGYSVAFTQYPVNGTAILSGGSLTLTGTDPVLNIFSITAAQLSSTSQVTISAPEESSVIINVTGDPIVWQGVGFQLPDGTASCRGTGEVDGSDTEVGWCQRILWNMPDCTSLTLSGIGVQGSILAPYATLTSDSGGGNVDGQIIVEYLYGGIEFHPYYFTGCLELIDVEL